MAKTTGHIIDSPTSSVTFRELSEKVTGGLGVIRRNRLATVGLLLITLVTFTALGADLIITQDPYEMNMIERLSGPSAQHLFGTDVFGRDIFTRVVLGTRIAMQVAMGAVLLAVIIGVPLGAFSGYMGGRVDTLIMRFIDAVLAFPGRLLAIAMVAAMGANFLTLWLAIGITSIPGYARVVRGVVLSQKEKEYVEAARMTGESEFSILFFQIIPNCIGPILVLVTLDCAHAITTESSLSFLGLGFAPPSPSWGLMLNEARGYMELGPHVALIPGLAISLTILGFNLLGDGLRDVFDPRQYDK